MVLLSLFSLKISDGGPRGPVNYEEGLLRSPSEQARAQTPVSAQPKDSRACAGLIIALAASLQHFSKRWGPIGGPNLCGLEPQLIKLEFIIYLPKLKVSAQIMAICLDYGPNQGLTGPNLR